MPARNLALFLLVSALGCGESPALLVAPPESMRTHYLVDFENTTDSTTLFALTGHLTVFNPGTRDADLTVTAYYEDHEPDRFILRARAGSSNESNTSQWPLRRNTIFALKVESTEPVICQATVGWTNTAGRYEWGAATRSPNGARETAKSYMAIRTLARHWLYADGVVIRDGVRQTVARWLPNPPPHGLWIRESEWAVMLNPGDQPAEVEIVLHYGAEKVPQLVTIPPRRVKRLFMDDIARPNRHYGVTVTSDRNIAVQWLRQVNWHDSPEPMAFWSVPAVPLAEANDTTR